MKMMLLSGRGGSFGFSQQRDCSVLVPSYRRPTQRYEPIHEGDEKALTTEIMELASVGTRRPSARICRVTHAGGHRFGSWKSYPEAGVRFSHQQGARQSFNPVTLEILWNRLISIADQSATTLVRTSFSTVVRECNDYACVLMDRNGDTLAENSGSIPSFVGTMSRTVKHFLLRFPPETWRPGDVVITNDPWMGTGHRPDFSMATPVFPER